ncbi:Pfs, NACHT and Ankyrin domain protein [Talaromyces stipitatus ATCC 10500]|uniref:Pfs, NACHT and Ankyrin domain protein n=1 Tax=Talaromyces stipitatus (strain ATCC 10500 / CBS 375.48 / QM 6759 / NRRL 1006) TaxID=441959 RepID=B8MI36_TALSN|nr:Pfs, NACHT and Ankyrin domain protein [Talaromyces stipitatus ATCC 10500]EED17198.1 Pfs, NACHT and Ankyrin domain protein [Talaromyces stipitatus ATCC 10500]
MVVSWPTRCPITLAMLDDRHTDLPKPQHDDNVYILGCIGMVGNIKSATVAAHMTSTFPSIKFGLMVGIGVAFGPKLDLAMSCALLAALTKLESKHDIEGSEIPRHLENLKQKWPRLVHQYLRTDSLNDILFKSSYHHIEKNASDDDWENEGEELNSCAYCDHTKVVKRKPAAHDMRIHYGLIASGNQVVKDAFRRNEINKMLGGNVLCFEMEAAGLMNDFSCIVIRGICDYADSHKNKDWQEHTAAVTAAFGKEFLSVVSPHGVEEMPIINDVYDSVTKMAGGVKTLTEKHHIQEQQAILEWLTQVDYTSQQNDFISKRQLGTGQWLLDSNEFQGWIAQTNQILFCPGIPGAGKTIPTSTVVDYLHGRFPDNTTIGIAYIYCNFRQQEEQRPMNVLSSILKQFAQGHNIISECVKILLKKHKSKMSRPSFREISDVLCSIIEDFSHAFIIIDALDECPIAGGMLSSLLLEIFNLQAKTRANLFAPSRFIPKIEEEFKRKGAVSLEIRASDNDVQIYLDDKISRLSLFVGKNPELEDRVKKAVITAADGMFLLATPHLNSLEDKVNPRQVENALKKLPKETNAYSQAYQQAMERIQSQLPSFCDLAFKTLAWISHTKRPLAPKELQHALAVVNNIHYTTLEYFQRTWSTWFPSAETDIAKTCINYLSFNDFRSGFCLTDHEFEERVQLHPLYSYASKNWGYHANAVSGIETKHDTCTASVNMEQLVAFLGDKDKVCASTSDGRMPLSWAAQKGYEMMVRFLLDKDGVNPDSKDFLGQTPLSLAARNGHDMIVNFLLEKDGVDPDSNDTDGRTPLSWAAQKGHDIIVKLLLDKDRVDPDPKDSCG